MTANLAKEGVAALCKHSAYCACFLATMHMKRWCKPMWNKNYLKVTLWEFFCYPIFAIISLFYLKWCLILIPLLNDLRLNKQFEQSIKQMFPLSLTHQTPFVSRGHPFTLLPFSMCWGWKKTQKNNVGMSNWCYWSKCLPNGSIQWLLVVKPWTSSIGRCAWYCISALPWLAIKMASIEGVFFTVFVLHTTLAAARAIWSK